MESDIASTCYTGMPDAIRPGKAHHRGGRSGRKEHEKRLAGNENADPGEEGDSMDELWEC